METKAQFAVKILREYADRTGNIVRGTSDLSPLEEWLLIKLYHQSPEYQAAVRLKKNIKS